MITIATPFDPQDVHISEAMSNYAVAYRNEETIWRNVMPLVRVPNRSDKYYIWDESTEFNVTADVLNANADPNEIQLSMSSAEFVVKSYGLAAWVPQESIDNADDAITPLLKAQGQVRRQLETQQEKRVAEVVFAAASYPSGYKDTLSGTSQWSDYTNSNPISAILTAMDVPLMRPNTLIISNDTWRVLRQHPKVVSAIFPLGGNAASGGYVTSQAFQQLLADEGITRVLIGRHRLNTAKPGATPTLSRVWGKHAALLFVDTSESVEDATWGKTFSESLTSPVLEVDRKKGEKGSIYVKDAWNCDVKVTANKAGWLFENAIA